MVSILFQEDPKRAGFWDVTLVHPKRRSVEPLHVATLGVEAKGVILGLHASRVAPTMINPSVEIPVVGSPSEHSSDGNPFQDQIEWYVELTKRACAKGKLFTKIRKYGILRSKDRRWIVERVRSILYHELRFNISRPICRAIAGSLALDALREPDL